jgi:hypothetical protein
MDTASGSKMARNQLQYPARLAGAGHIGNVGYAKPNNLEDSGMKRLSAMVAALLLVGVVSGWAQTNSLVGQWSTGEIPSGVNHQEINYWFGKNGGFNVGCKITKRDNHTGRPDGEIGAFGTYQATTNQITTITNTRTNIYSYHFDGSTLVMDAGLPPGPRILRLTKNK